MSGKVAQNEFERHLLSYKFFKGLETKRSANLDTIDTILGYMDNNLYTILATILIVYVLLAVFSLSDNFRENLNMTLEYIQNIYGQVYQIIRNQV